jgi:cytoskeletal protein RodZ
MAQVSASSPGVVLRRLLSAIVVIALLAGCTDPTDPHPLRASSSESSSETEAQSTSASSSGPASATGGTSTSSTTPTSPGTSKGANQLVLLAADMPASTVHPWSSGPPTSDPEDAAPNATDYAQASVQRFSGTPRVVDTYVDVFATSAEALAYYNTMKADLAGHALVPVQAGDQAFMWTDSPGYQEEGWIVKQNVVWYLYIAGEGGTPSPTTDSLMKKAAAKF